MSQLLLSAYLALSQAAGQSIAAPRADDHWAHFDAAVEQVLALKSRLIGARSAAALAAAACRLDRAHARIVFARAMEHLRAADPSGAGGGLAVRGYLLEACRRCDPILAQSLAATPGPSVFDTFEDELRRALSEAAADPDLAAASALRAAPLLPWASDHQRTGFARMLLKLRRTNADTADGVFADVLEALSDDPAEAVPSLFALGNYVLAPSAKDDDDIRTVGEEGGGTAYVFRAERPAAPGELRIAYLESAVFALALPPPAAGTSAAARASDELRREMLDRLRPFVARWTPHLRPLFNSAARRLSASELDLGEEPPAAWYSNFSPIDFLREWTRGRGDAMRDLVVRLPRRTPPGPYLTLVSFSEAVHAIGGRQPDLAAAIASRMPEGVHKTLVHGGLPGRESVFLFYREAAEADAEVRPGLLLIAAQLLAPEGPDAATSALRQAIEGLNDLDRSRRQPGALRFSTSGFVQDLGSLRFALVVPSLPHPDLRAAVAALAPRDPERVLALITQVQAERRRAPALVAWAQAMLPKEGATEEH